MQLEDIYQKLIKKMGFKYYDEDKFLIIKSIQASHKTNPKVLDVGCGIGHHAFLFEKNGAEVTAFDYDANLIEKANELKKQNNSNVEFLIFDGNYPEKYLNENYDIIFMAGFSIFGTSLNVPIMEKYLRLLNEDGKIVLVHNSNLTGIVRRSNWKNHTIQDFQLFFQEAGASVDAIYFYDRHILIKILRNFVLTKFSTNLHILISRITKLPCALVFIATKKEIIDKI